LNLTGNTEAGIVRIDTDNPTHVTWIKGFEADGNGFMVSGLDMNFRSRQNPLTGATKRVQNVWFHDMDANGGGNIYNYGMAIRGTGSAPIANYELVDNEVQNPPRDGIANYPDATGSIANVLIRGNIVHGHKNDASYGEGHGIGVKGNLTNVIVEYNYVYGVYSSAIYLSANDSAERSDPIIRYNILTTDDVPGSRGTIRCYAGTKSAQIYGNILYGVDSGPSIDFNGSCTAISGRPLALIYNNTVVNGYVSLAGKGGIEFKNNIVRAGEGQTALVSTSGASVANNLTYNDGSGNPGFANIANVPTGFVNSYPNLKPNTDGLSIVSGTALGGGVSLGSSYNGSINSQTRASGDWDIGAYQSGDSGGSPGGAAPGAPSGLRIVSQ
jgi:hypothetical protein